MFTKRTACWMLLTLTTVGLPVSTRGEQIDLSAKETLTALEMDEGDALTFRLADGRVFRLVLQETSAAIVERVTPGGIVYRFAARVRVDGQPMTLERYVCSQECFYEPWVVDGVRIWLDTVRDVFDLIPVRYPHQGNLQCVPRKDARLAIQDARLRICPPELQRWTDDAEDFIDVGRCYNGDDCYLGPYLGQACHVGMDINQAKGSRLFAPLDFDTHAYFNSLAMGDNNNRWRGIRRWDNGDIWALQTHHLIRLLVPENTALGSGTPYATTAGVHVGSHEHTHFEFKIGRSHHPHDVPMNAETAVSIAEPIDFDDETVTPDAAPEVLHLDPWIVFWQSFEDHETRNGTLQAAMESVGPARTGESASFAALASPERDDEKPPKYYWTFGDGGSATGLNPSHVFATPGVYPVTLVVDNGKRRDTITQHISVSGDPISRPVLALVAPNAVGFHRRPVSAADVYGAPVRTIPHTLQFVTRASRPVPTTQTIQLKNLGGGVLNAADPPRIECPEGSDWLRLAAGGQHNDQMLNVSVDATGLEPGTYGATVRVCCPGAVNAVQTFCVRMDVRHGLPPQRVTIDDRDTGFSATPYYWVGHRFCRCPADRRGHGGFYLTNGSRPAVGQSARFTPDLRAGRYRVSFSEQTPFATGVQFDVRVRHAGGEQTVTVRPAESREIGTWQFDEGADGFVEMLAEGSQGLVIADAVTFEPR